MLKVITRKTGSVRKLGLLIVLIAAVVVAVAVWVPKSTLIRAPKNTFHVAIADTDELQQKGLSGHDPLGEDGGMLFVFDRPAAYGFWMKDMNFPIDIIWLNSDKEIIKISNDIKPESFPEQFCPESPVQHVIELQSGEAANNNLVVGQKLKF